MEGVRLWSAVAAFFFPSLGGLLFGYDIGITSWALTQLQSSARGGVDWTDDVSDSALLQGTIASGGVAGALLGTILVFDLADSLGRRRELLISAVLCAIGALFEFVAGAADAWGAVEGIGTLLMGRVVFGVGLGFALHGAPNYIAEAAPPSIRGIMVSLKEFMTMIGLALGYTVGAVFFTRDGGWKYAYAIGIPISGVMFIGMWWLPPSPRWLVLENRVEEAKQAIAWMLTEPAAAETLLQELLEPQAAATSSACGKSQTDVLDNSSNGGKSSNGGGNSRSINTQPATPLSPGGVFAGGFLDGNDMHNGQLGEENDDDNMTRSSAHGSRSYLQRDRPSQGRKSGRSSVAADPEELFASSLSSSGSSRSSALSSTDERGRNHGGGGGSAGTAVPEGEKQHRRRRNEREANEQQIERAYRKKTQDEHDAREGQMGSSVARSSAGTEGNASEPSIFTAEYVPALRIGIGLVFFQQLTGQPSVLYFLGSLFEDAGVSAVASIGVAGFMIISTGIAVAAVDRVGRKTLLYTGIGIMTVSVTVITLAYAVLETEGDDDDDDDDGGGSLSLGESILLVSMFLYLGGYQISFGPISWLLISEIFPLNVRGRAASVAVSSNFFFNVLTSLLFPTLLNSIGTAGTFAIFLALLFCSLGFIFVYVHETKGLSLEQIQEALRSQSSQQEQKRGAGQDLEQPLLMD